MSRLEVPLLGRKLWATGDILVRAELDLLLKDAAGNLAAETFRADPGSEMTTLTAAAPATVTVLPLEPVSDVVGFALFVSFVFELVPVVAWLPAFAFETC